MPLTSRKCAKCGGSHSSDNPITRSHVPSRFLLKWVGKKAWLRYGGSDIHLHYLCRNCHKEYTSKEVQVIKRHFLAAGAELVGLHENFTKGGTS
jgi:hypothetical protein